MKAKASHITKFSFVLIMVGVLVLIISSTSLAQVQNFWTASYWNNMNLAGSPSLQRSEPGPISYHWGKGSPAPGLIQEDFFSVRWNSFQIFSPGRYRFTIKSDDGARLWVNNHLIINEWQDATNVSHTAEYDITTSGSLPVTLEFYENQGDAQIHLTWERIGDPALVGSTRAEYFDNMTLSGNPVLVRYEGELFHRWGTSSPSPGIVPNDRFSARYTRSLDLEAGLYKISYAADDGIRMWVDGNLLINDWYDSEAEVRTIDLSMTDGIHTFVVEYYENVGNAEIAVTGERVGSSGGSGGGTGGGTGGTGVRATVDTSYLNLRSGPGVQFSVIEVLERGAVLQLTGNQFDYWVEVVAPNGLIGWVSNGYLAY